MNLLECTNPVRNKWRARWDVQPSEEAEGQATYLEQEFQGCPLIRELEAAIAQSGADASEQELREMARIMDIPEEEFLEEYDRCKDERIEADPVAQMLVITRERNLAARMTDGQVLRVPALFPSFAELCRRGDSVPKDAVLRYRGRPWRVLQEHTPQEQYPPSMDTAALYARIDRQHAGTAADPISYEQGMALEKGKYYEQSGVVYECIADMPTGMPYDLKDIPAIAEPVTGGQQP